MCVAGRGKCKKTKATRNLQLSVLPTGVTDSVSSVYTSASAASSIIFKPMSSERASRCLQGEQQYTTGVEVDSFVVLLSIHLLFPLRLDLSRLEETAHPFLCLCWLRSP